MIENIKGEIKFVLNEIKSFLRSNSFKQFVLLVLLFTLPFLIYILTFGHKMTQAKNEFNKAYRYYQAGNYEEAQKYFEKSNSTWQSPEAQEYLKILENSN